MAPWLEQPRTLATAKLAAVRPDRRDADHWREIRMLRDLHSLASRWSACSSDKSFEGKLCCSPQSDPGRSITPSARSCYCYAATTWFSAAADSAETMSADIVAASACAPMCRPRRFRRSRRDG